MSEEKPAVTTRNFGIKEFTINVDSRDDAIDGILDTMSHTYWLFDDLSGINFALELRYTLDGVAKNKRFEPYTWTNGLRGAKEYLARIGKSCMKRMTYGDITEFVIELRFLDAAMVYLIGIEEDQHATVVADGGNFDSPLASLKADPKYRKQMAVLMEMNT